VEKILRANLAQGVKRFFILTPLPGSQDHKTLLSRGAWMEPDLNTYDQSHVTTQHPRMSKADLKGAYDDAWLRYYSLDHIEVIMRRAGASGMNVGNMAFLTLWFYGTAVIERVHPLEGGWIRRKVRRHRRSDLPRPARVPFAIGRGWEISATLGRWVALGLKVRAIRKRLKKDPDARAYTDLALTPLEDWTEDGKHATEIMREHGSKIGRTHGAPTSPKAVAAPAT